MSVCFVCDSLCDNVWLVCCVWCVFVVCVGVCVLLYARVFRVCSTVCCVVMFVCVGVYGLRLCEL